MEYDLGCKVSKYASFLFYRILDLGDEDIDRVTQMGDVFTPQIGQRDYEDEVSECWLHPLRNIIAASELEAERCWYSCYLIQVMDRPCASGVNLPLCRHLQDVDEFLKGVWGE